MPSLLAIRFPNGDVEYRSSIRTVEVGSILVIGAETWRVVAFDAELRTCRVQPAEPRSQWSEKAPPHGTSSWRDR